MKSFLGASPVTKKELLTLGGWKRLSCMELLELGATKKGSVSLSSPTHLRVNHPWLVLQHKHGRGVWTGLLPPGSQQAGDQEWCDPTTTYPRKPTLQLFTVPFLLVLCRPWTGKGISSLRNIIDRRLFTPLWFWHSFIDLLHAALFASRPPTLEIFPSWPMRFQQIPKVWSYLLTPRNWLLHFLL